jgi:RNA polymerase sigma-70 factor (ECF subfamily)
MSVSDSALLQQWRTHGESEAFREIVQRYSRSVFATSLRVLGNQNDAEEVAQECFLILARADVSIDSSLGGWLHTIATRRSIDRIRSDSRRRDREKNYSQSLADESVRDWENVALHVDECIDELPEKTRNILVAYYFGQSSQADIARENSISQSTVSRILGESIEEVRRALRQRGVAVPAAALASGLSASAETIVPDTLNIILGKIAISGGPMSDATQVVAGGIFMSKKMISIGLILCTLLIGYGALYLNDRLELSNRPEGANIVAVPISADNVTLDDESVDSSIPLGQENEPALTLSENETSRETPETLAPVPSGNVKGVVLRLGDNNTPVPHREVQLWSDSEANSLRTRSDSHGEFQFVDVEVGNYSIRVADEKVLPAREPVTFKLRDGDLEDNVELWVSDGGAIEGRITIGHLPAANSKIPISQLGGGKNLGNLIASTDSDGWYRLDGVLEGERQFYAELQLGDRSNIWSDMPRAEVVAGEVSQVDFKFLRGTGTLDGLILLNGEPAKNRQIVVTFFESSRIGVLGQVHLKTDDTGRYAMEGVPFRDVFIGAALKIRTGKYIYPGDEGTIRKNSGVESVIDFEFTQSNSVLEGIISIDGQPAANRRVLVSGDFANTDEKGFYRVEGVKKGSFSLWAQLLTNSGKIFTSDQPIVQIADGETRTANFDFPGGTAVIEGHVRAEDGTPVGGRVGAYFVGANGDTVYFTARINLEGKYRIENLPAQSVELALWLLNGEPYPLPVAPLETIAGETIEFDLVVPNALKN